SRRIGIDALGVRASGRSAGDGRARPEARARAAVAGSLRPADANAAGGAAIGAHGAGAEGRINGSRLYGATDGALTAETARTGQVAAPRAELGVARRDIPHLLRPVQPTGTEPRTRGERRAPAAREFVGCAQRHRWGGAIRAGTLCSVGPAAAAI